MQRFWICAAILLNGGAALAEEKPYICYYNDHADYTKVESAPAGTAIGEVATVGYYGDKVYSYTISARESTACPNQVPLGAKTAMTVAMVRQESESCSNDDVSAAEPAPLVGSVTVYRASSRATGVNLHLVGAAPDTVYEFRLKCGDKLGTLKTDASGNGDRTFNFQADPATKTLAFEVTSAGGPKLESVKIVK